VKKQHQKKKVKKKDSKTQMLFLKNGFFKQKKRTAKAQKQTSTHSKTPLGFA
jgi:hypothetical protein